MSAIRSTTPSRAWPTRSSTELTAGHPDRIKVCASDTCDWIFYDASRTSRRRWCDMATCGNRAKAARHRAKERAAGQAAQITTDAATGPAAQA